MHTFLHIYLSVCLYNDNDLTLHIYICIHYFLKSAAGMQLIFKSTYMHFETYIVLHIQYAVCA